MEMMLELVPLSLATAAAAIAISRSHIFERVRERFPSLGCHFCVSVWLAALFASMYVGTPYYFPLLWLATVGGSAVVIRVVLGDE